MLNNNEFIEVVQKAPLVSLDLIVPSGTGELLVGLRVNEPASGSWFVPGGRLRKNESIEQAFSRITEAELGRAYTIDQARLLGAFTHKYETNFARVPGVSTHYVVLAYELRVAIDINRLPAEQHSGYRWVGNNSDLTGVHANTQAYFPYLSVS
ncbi:MAG: GDP-mannose mannosyl hydrolase [Methylobacter sp.]